MNKIYKSIWNAALGAWVAVSEIAKSSGKSSGSSVSGGLTGALASSNGQNAASIFSMKRICALIALIFALPSSLNAAAFTVNNVGDWSLQSDPLQEDQQSLAYALQKAGSGDNILLGGTLNLTSAPNWATNNGVLVKTNTPNASLSFRRL